MHAFALSFSTLTLTSTFGSWSTVGALVMYGSCYVWCLSWAAGLWAQALAFSFVTLTFTSACGSWSTVGAMVMDGCCCGPSCAWVFVWR